MRMDYLDKKLKKVLKLNAQIVGVIMVTLGKFVGQNLFKKYPCMDM